MSARVSHRANRGRRRPRGECVTKIGAATTRTRTHTPTMSIDRPAGVDPGRYDEGTTVSAARANRAEPAPRAGRTGSGSAARGNREVAEVRRSQQLLRHRTPRLRCRDKASGGRRPAVRPHAQGHPAHPLQAQLAAHPNIDSPCLVELPPTPNCVSSTISALMFVEAAPPPTRALPTPVQQGPVRRRFVVSEVTRSAIPHPSAPPHPVQLASAADDGRGKKLASVRQGPPATSRTAPSALRARGSTRGGRDLTGNAGALRQGRSPAQITQMPSRGPRAVRTYVLGASTRWTRDREGAEP